MTRRRAVWAVAALVLAAGACGVPEDSAPRALDESALPAEIVSPPSTTSTTTDVATTLIDVFLVDGETLAAAEREVARPATPLTALEQLLAGPTEAEREQGLASQLSSGWELRSVDLAGRTVVIDLGPETLEVLEGQNQRQAIAQIVFTVTGLTDIDDVLIQIEGNPRPLPTDDGEADGETPVNRDDYRSLEP